MKISMKNCGSRKNKKIKPKLVQQDGTRLFQIPYGPFHKVDDVIKAFRYELKNELDRGGFGVVYIAKDLRKNIDVACKEINLDPHKPGAIKENKNELLIMEKVRHPYVIPVHCHFIVQGPNTLKMYIFMALADGGNLNKFLKKRDSLIDENQAKLYFAQIISGINHMHGVGIAHRDIKLANVLLRTCKESISGDYLCCVTDFGLSKLVENSKDLARTICGTQYFMAPELLQYKPYNAFAVDIWALGITSYMMLSLEVPFDFNKPDQYIVQQMIARKYNYQPFKSEPSAKYKQLLHRMLDPNPATRITMIEIVKHPWIQKEYLAAKAVSNFLKNSLK